VKSVMPTEFPSLGVPWLMSALASLYGRARLADSLPPLANVVVSNVPGPRVPMYLAGARMTTNFPVSIVTHGLALNVTVQSYDGALDFGIVACRRAVPDIGLFAACMLEAHKELLAALPAAPRKRAARKAA
jgi:diacylglycerol O-acyltransferase